MKTFCRAAGLTWPAATGPGKLLRTRPRPSCLRPIVAGTAPRLGAKASWPTTSLVARQIQLGRLTPVSEKAANTFASARICGWQSVAACAYYKLEQDNLLVFGF